MDLGTLMFIAYRSMDTQVISAVQDAGYRVTHAEARLVQRIAEEGSRLTDLAEQAQVTKQTASLLVTALEEEGLVERVPDPSDGRARLIRLTDRGLAAGARARATALQVEQRWREHLGPDLEACLREALVQLREIVDPYR